MYSYFTYSRGCCRAICFASLTYAQGLTMGGRLEGLGVQVNNYYKITSISIYILLEKCLGPQFTSVSWPKICYHAQHGWTEPQTILILDQNQSSVVTCNMEWITVIKFFLWTLLYPNGFFRIFQFFLNV